MTDASDSPERIWLEYYPEEHFVHFKPVEFVGVVNGAEYVRADLAATLPAPVEALVEALRKLDAAASEVIRISGTTNAQWMRLDTALITARAALAAYEGDPA